MHGVMTYTNGDVAFSSSFDLCHVVRGTFAAARMCDNVWQVREIFGEHRPFLFAQLQKLIRQVISIRAAFRTWGGWCRAAAAVAACGGSRSDQDA